MREPEVPLWSRSLILLTAAYAAVGYFQYLFFYWIHYYFDSVLSLSAGRSRLFSALPVLAMALAMPAGGWLADWARTNPPRRRSIPMLGMLFCSFFLAIGLLAADARWVVVWFTLALGALGLSEAMFWVTAVEIGGARGGTAAACMNTGGNGVGLLAPALTPMIAAHLGWKWGLGLGALICVGGALCWLGVGEREGTRRNEKEWNVS